MSGLGRAIGTALRVATVLSRPQKWLKRQLGQLLERNDVLRWLRRRRPVLCTPAFTLVVKDAEVREVLACRDSFTVDLNGPKMERLAGAFALGLDDERYPPARRILAHTFADGDIDRITTRSGALAEQRLADALPSGRIDLVNDLVDPVLAEVVPAHLGGPEVDPRTFMAWTRIIFREIFINPGNDPDVRRRADEAAEGMHAELARLLAACDGSGDTVLDRLVRARPEDPNLTDASIRGNLLGLAAAWPPNFSKSFTLAIEELLDRPAALAVASRAALDDDRSMVAHCLFEALRFRPQNSSLVRLCVRDHEVGSGTPRATWVTKGTVMLASTKSAMMDEEVHEEPAQFRTDRERTDYLHFGYGRHACLGESLVWQQFPAVAMPLLRLRNLRRAPGPAGQVAYDGPYPSAFEVRFEPPV